MFIERHIWPSLVTCAAIVLSGCASLSDEGGTDYRKAQPANKDQLKAFYDAIEAASIAKKTESKAPESKGPENKAPENKPPENKPSVNKTSVNKAPGNPVPENKAPENESPDNKAPANKPENTGPVLLTPLLRKDMELVGEPASIGKLDKVSIRLRDGFLKDCNEFMRSVRRNFDKNCEIAILFRAFELGEGNDFNFKPGAERDARLVYFSHDVRPGQFFNLHNLPVYGPIDFSGRPLAIDAFMIEIDAEDQQVFALFKSLASAGAKAFAPAAPVLELLDGLGSSLLDSGTDDMQYRYSFVLDPAGGYKGTVYATAEAGDYVFIRTKNRDLQIDWKDLFLDHNTGRIWKMVNGTPELYRDHTYLSVQILKNAGSDDVILSQNNYGDFRDTLQRDATDKANKLQEALIPALEAMALKRVQARAFNTAQKRFERMTADCDSESEGWQRPAFDLFAQTKEAVDGLSCKPDASGTPVKTDLSQAQVNYLLKRMRDRSKAQSEGEIKAFEPGCKANFTALEFPAFIALMCPTKTENPEVPSSPSPTELPVAQPDPVSAATEESSETSVLPQPEADPPG